MTTSKVVGETVQSKFWVDLQDVPLVNIINTNILYAWDIGQGHLHQHYLHFQRHICPVLFSRDWDALGERGGIFPTPTTTIFALSTTVNSISTPSINLFKKKFLGELVLHWRWRSLAGKDTVIVAGGYPWSVWICCRVQVIRSLKVLPDQAHQWSPQGFILIDENDLTKTRLSPLAHRTREALRPVACTQEEKSILVKR